MNTTRAAPTEFPIVGIGASAGGLKAFEAFFSGLPEGVDPGMAFVLVQHLAPDHVSILADLIKHFTHMPVCDVRDGMTVKINTVCIIPPNYDMALLGGRLQLLKPAMPHGQRLPIDFFFRSLAQDQREKAIGIVLSGTGSDGTLGVRAIKGEGGLVMAQAPDSCEFDGMPRSAIATGLVDYELAPAEMPAKLIAYTALALAKFKPPASNRTPEIDNALQKTYILLRDQTGHDFSQYKPSTFQRRIQRRMAVNHVDAIDDYVSYLQRTPVEVAALFRDLLIGVTSFFRDPAAFKVLEQQAIPKLFEDKQPGERVRIWSPGCSTGEEPYSLAMLLFERMETLKQNFTLQIFATDIDSQAIASARIGRYPVNIATDIAPERLQHFFSLETGGGSYRVRNTIRDMLTFSEHDVIKDPPFSGLDLISCRNLFIYLNGDLQRKLLGLFHYALKPGGLLFLGTSEGVNETDNLFAVVDRKAKLYQRKTDSQGAQRAALASFLPAMTVRDGAPRPEAGKKTPPVKLSLQAQTEQTLLSLFTPACALVNGQGDIFHLRGRTGMYLEPAPGDAGINNILKMAREGLRQDLTIALHKAVATQAIVRRPDLSVKTNGHFAAVNLTVCPATASQGEDSKSKAYLVVLEEAPAVAPEPLPAARLSGGLDGAADSPGLAGDARIEALRQELRVKEEFLRSTNEELETSTEELKSANEEMQSVNEELQSSNEELATSKEELQSVNEELATVNAELQSKVGELSRAVNDMNNLLAGTGIGTVFVDLQQKILSFTPAANQIINLVPSDVGRPVGHFVANLLGYDRLTEDIKAVLDTLIAKEMNVQTRLGEWFTMRILPYRTTNNVIEGAVITFVNITEMIKAYVRLDELKTAHAALQDAEQRYHSVVSALSEGVVLHGRDGKLVAWNPAAERIFGLSSQEMQQRTTLDPRWRTIHEDGSPFPAETRPSQEVFRTGVPQKDVVMGLERPDGTLAWISVNAMPIFAAGDPVPTTVVISFSDISERKRTTEALRIANEFLRLAVVVRDSHDAVTLQGLDGRILAWNPGAVRMYGWSETEALQMNALERIPPAQHLNALARIHALSQAKTLEPFRTQRLTKDGAIVDVSITATALLDEAGQVYAISTMERTVEGENHD